jgi:DNA-directed RNA polymerase specialized sigma24 family protein
MSNDSSLDEILLGQARRGDSEALVKFATRWWAPVFRLAWNMLGSAAEAAEATEQTILLAIRFPEAVSHDGPFGISLRGAAIDLVLLRCGPVQRSPTQAPGEPSRAAPPGGSSQRPDLGETIRGTLQRLEDLDRAAFVLREIEQLSVEETVAILRMPASQVRSRTHRALAVLTGLLGIRTAGAAAAACAPS